MTPDVELFSFGSPNAGPGYVTDNSLVVVKRKREVLCLKP
jgi:hypothetical protein